MKVTVTGATGLIGRALVHELLNRGDDVTILTRDPAGAKAQFTDVRAIQWDPASSEAPIEALDGRDAVVHLAGEPVAQRWTPAVKEAIRESRVAGTANLVAGLRQSHNRPGVLISGSAVGFYGPRGEDPVTEGDQAGDDFLAGVCVAWERAALEAAEFGIRTTLIRTGVVLSPSGGALAKMLPPFKAGVGGPVAGGAQMVPWIHLDDAVGIIIAALDGDERWSGPINATAPIPVSNRELSKTLGAVLHRPAFAPVPAAALKILYGEMAQIITTGQNAIPAKATDLGYRWKQPDLQQALTGILRS